MYFRNYRLQKRSVDKCLKNDDSEYPSKNNMINAHKHYWNLDGRIFTIFISICEDNSVGKSVC